MKEIFSAVINKGIENVYIKDIMKTPCLVPETIPIDKLLKDMKDSKIIYL